MMNTYERSLERIILYMRINDCKRFQAKSSIRLNEYDKYVFRLIITDKKTGAIVSEYEEIESWSLNDTMKIFNRHVLGLSDILSLNSGPQRIISICHRCKKPTLGHNTKSTTCHNCLREMSYSEEQTAIRYKSKRFVYLMMGEKTKNLKIGFSTNPERRLSQLQTASSEKLVLLVFVGGSKKLEKSLHLKHASLGISGEWFQYSDIILNDFKDIFFQQSGIELVI